MQSCNKRDNVQPALCRGLVFNNNDSSNIKHNNKHFSLCSSSPSLLFVFVLKKLFDLLRFSEVWDGQVSVVIKAEPYLFTCLHMHESTHTKREKDQTFKEQIYHKCVKQIFIHVRKHEKDLISIVSRETQSLYFSVYYIEKTASLSHCLTCVQKQTKKKTNNASIHTKESLALNTCTHTFSRRKPISQDDILENI